MSRQRHVKFNLNFPSERRRRIKKALHADGLIEKCRGIPQVSEPLAALHGGGQFEDCLSALMRDETRLS